MFSRLPIALYRQLLQLLHGGSQSHHAPTHHVLQVSDWTRARFGPQPQLGPVDAEAARLGSLYRGLGVLVALLACVLLLLALLPYALALDLHSPLKTLLNGLKLALMLGLGILILTVRRFPRDKPLKLRWIETRLLAEELRYAPLREALQGRDGGHSAAALDAALAPLLDDGPQCQLRYNQARCQAYEQVELRVGLLTWVGFVLSALAALAAALLNAVGIKASGLLLLTGFLPGAIALLHGLIGWLKLPQLALAHKAMAVRLADARAEWLRLRAQPDAALDDRRRVALAVYRCVSRGDAVWSGMADELDMQPL